MIKKIDLSKSSKYKLPYLSSNEFKKQFNKGWGYFYIYHFREFKDIYLAVKKYKYSSLSDFTDIVVNKIKIKPVQTPWDSEGRRINEYINALKKLMLVNDNGEVSDNGLFINSNIGDEISNEDITHFKELFFKYFRFREIMSWFIDPSASISRNELIDTITENTLKHNSNVIFTFPNQSRFNDSFFFELADSTSVYYIDNKDEDFMRFWDVFISWAKSLNLIEKLNLKNLDIVLTNNQKSISCVYFISDGSPNFSLIDFIKENYHSKYINASKLVFRLAIKYRLPIEKVKTEIIKQCLEMKNRISMQRTSKIFIKDKTELDCMPKLNNYYISHLMVL